MTDSAEHDSANGYFHRVAAATPTRPWINNPTLWEADEAIRAGAINATTNPSYVAGLLQQEPDVVRAMIVNAADDADAADLVVQKASARHMERFLPLRETSQACRDL